MGGPSKAAAVVGVVTAGELPFPPWQFDWASVSTLSAAAEPALSTDSSVWPLSSRSMNFEAV